MKNLLLILPLFFSLQSFAQSATVRSWAQAYIQATPINDEQFSHRIAGKNLICQRLDIGIQPTHLDELRLITSDIFISARACEMEEFHACGIANKLTKSSVIQTGWEGPIFQTQYGDLNRWSYTRKINDSTFISAISAPFSKTGLNIDSKSGIHNASYILRCMAQ